MVLYPLTRDDIGSMAGIHEHIWIRLLSLRTRFTHQFRTTAHTSSYATFLTASFHHRPPATGLLWAIAKAVAASMVNTPPRSDSTAIFLFIND